MGVRLLRSCDYLRQPWKNGGGTTTEIWRERSSAAEFDWRLSIAEVEANGPFSIFPGIDRHIMLIAGAGMLLRHKGANIHRLDNKFAPYGFSGDIEIDCDLLGGPCRDMNLMVRRNFALGQMAVHDIPSGATAAALPEDAALLHLLSGTARMGEIVASSGDSFVAQGKFDRAIEIETDAKIVFIHIGGSTRP